jgi:hypothetical protein
MAPELKWSRKLGAIHHARWMAAIIYLLKMLILGPTRFSLSAAQQRRLMDMAFFILYVYALYWFSVPVAADAPFLTLSLWKDLNRWKARDKELSRACQRKLDLHTWYLNALLVLLGLWSSKVDDNTKVEMVMRLLASPQTPLTPGKPDRPRVYEEKELPDFVSDSWHFFQVS